MVVCSVYHTPFTADSAPLHVKRFTPLHLIMPCHPMLWLRKPRVHSPANSVLCAA
jgi:hypothetical protein